MYDIYLYGNLTESHPDYFQAKCRADYLYMQGHVVEIRQGEKVLVKYMNFGGVK